MTEAYIIDAVRTPVGRRGGGLSKLAGIELGGVGLGGVGLGRQQRSDLAARGAARNLRELGKFVLEQQYALGGNSRGIARRR